MPKYLILSQQETFEYRPPEFAGDVVLQYQHLTPERSEVINAKYRRTRIVNGIPVGYFPPETEAAREEDMRDALLVGWSGVVDKDTRAPVPCTREWKLLFFTQWSSTWSGLLAASQVNVTDDGHEAARPT